MKTGSVFYVKAPSTLPQLQSASESTSSSKKSSVDPINGYSGLTPVPPPPSEPAPFSQCLDTPNHTPSAPTALLKVKIPPGTVSGSTLHVQVPGENRLIAVQVPPNCNEFHVQYEPRQPTKTRQPAGVPASQKLLLVTVPPNTKPGTTLRVQVPNEPGRLLSAQVPPGNVRQFHVSYQPRITAARYGSTQQQQNTYRFSQQHDTGNDWGAAALPVAGALATGVAGAMVYDHFAHH